MTLKTLALSSVLVFLVCKLSVSDNSPYLTSCRKSLQLQGSGNSLLKHNKLWNMFVCVCVLFIPLSLIKILLKAF